MIGVSLWREPSISRLVDQVVDAEAIGVPSVWLPSGGIYPDALTVVAAAATRTRTVKLGTAVLPIWARHPISVAESAHVIASLAPGRLRVGLGVSLPDRVQAYGATW